MMTLLMNVRTALQQPSWPANRRPLGCGAAVFTAVLLALTGCSQQRVDEVGDAGSNDDSNQPRRSAAQDDDALVQEHRNEQAVGLGDLDFGEDWDTGLPATNTTRGNNRRSTSTTDNAAVLSPEIRDDVLGGGSGGSGNWTIVLRTFSTENHRTAAETMVRELLKVDPMLTRARAVHREDGSMVVYGRYENATSDTAKADLRKIKSITIGERLVFPRAMMTRVDSGANPNQGKQLALIKVRELYPDVDPLYTLDIAVWIDESSNAAGLRDAQRKAEAYAAELRTQGHLAFFHHDQDKRMSMVTVGLFDRRAIDPTTNWFSADVQELMRQFPARLVNGEELQVPIRDNLDETEAQRPFLVLVPELE